MIFIWLQRLQFEDKFKSAQNEAIDKLNEVKKKADQDTLKQQEVFGEDLPDPNVWKSYFRDEEVLANLDKDLKELETATDEAIDMLQRAPGKCF